jgi:predicted permease
LLQVFFTTLFPVFFVVGSGYALQRRFSLDAKTVSRTCLYLFTPCFIFSSLSNRPLSGTHALTIWAFVILFVAIMCCVSWLCARAWRLTQEERAAFSLSTVFANGASFGPPVLLFAFGDEGLQLGLLYVVALAPLVHTLGVYLASRGRVGIGDSVSRVFRVPMVYAVACALLVNVLDVPLPEPFVRAVDLLGQPWAPTLPVLLGMQLARASLRGSWRLLAVAVFGRLVIAVGISLGLASLMGMDGVVRRVCVVTSSAPTAVSTIMLATEFDTRPDLVTGVVFLSTLASMVTLTLLLAVMM